MTRLLVSTLLFFLLCMDTVAQPAADSPVDHMNFLSQQDKNLSMNYLSYMSEVAHGRRAKKMEKRRMELINSINEAIREATKLRPFKSDAALRDAFKQYWTVLLTVFKEDYHKIVDMEEVAEQSYDDMEAYLLIKEKANEKLHEASAKIPVAFEAFASRHNVLLSEGQTTKLSERLAQAGKVNHYVNQVYLLFFKSNFQEGMMFKAMEKNDVNGVEQSKNSLTKFSVEGLSKLDTIKPFNGDASLVTACRKVLEFQKSEGEDKASYMTEFLIKREDFEKTKKSFEAKSSNSRTQADIKAYNKAIEDFNKAINTYNKTNTELNASRAKIMESWEAAQKKFMDVHVPRKL
jgi:hypothetical protein